MDFRFGSKRLQEVWTGIRRTLGHGEAIDERFCERVQIIKNASDERDLRALRSLNFERLKGKRKHQWSIRLNDQWRLILEREETAEGKPRWVLVEVEDYH